MSKVTIVHKAPIVTNDSIFSGRPGCNFPYEQTTKFVQVTRPARVPGSYEEALGAFYLYVSLTEESTKMQLLVICLFHYLDSLKMITRCRLRTLLTLMVLLHLSMCHSAMSWLPKKQRKDNFDNTT